jgi:hypothetical protein
LKKTFRIIAKIKNCKTIFKEELGEGVIGSIDCEYDLDPEEYNKPSFVAHLMDKSDELRNDLIECDIREIIKLKRRKNEDDRRN